MWKKMFPHNLEIFKIIYQYLIAKSFSIIGKVFLPLFILRDIYLGSLYH